MSGEHLPFLQNLLKVIDARITAGLNRIGVVGSKITGSHISGTIPVGSVPAHASTHKSGGADIVSPFGGEFSAVDLAVSGMTGAVSASRYVGGTVSGAPTTGTFAIGDCVVDRSGSFWECTAAGTPGTWKQANIPMTLLGDLIYGGPTPAGLATKLAGNITALRKFLRQTGTGAVSAAPVWEEISPYGLEFEATDFKVDGLTGAVSASRYVGATASGAPATGTFAVGDFIITQDAHIFVCTVPGTPGTWGDAGPVRSVFGRTGAVTAQSGDYSAALVSIAKLGSPTVDQVQEYLDSTGSSGFFTGGLITDAGGGAINISAGAGFIRATTTETDPLLSFGFGAFLAVAIPSDTTRWVYVSYNAGVPTYVLSASEFDEATDKILLGVAINEGGSILDVVNVGVRLQESIGLAGRFLRRTHGITRDNRRGGLILGHTGTLKFSLTAGSLWWGRTEYTIAALDTNVSGSFDRYYRASPSGWIKESAQTDWPNTKYDNDSGTLVVMGVNKWAVLWFYLQPDGHVLMLYGRAQYNNQAAAEMEAVPSTSPGRISEIGNLIGRFVFQKSSSTPVVSSAYSTVFTNTGVTDHDDLSNVTANQHHAQDHNHVTGDSSGLLTNDEHDGYSEYAAIATPSNPASGKLRVYPKTDKKLYLLDTDGTETDLTASGVGSAHIIQEEGTPLTARANLNFIGSHVTAADDAGNNATTVTVIDPTMGGDSGGGGTAGDVPAPGAGDAAAGKYLKADATWAVPPTTDPNAVHVNVASEISGITEKTVPIGNDLLILEDSAAANVKKRVKISNLPDVLMVGDTGAGGVAGDVPAPALGDAAAGKYLKADATWVVPPNTFDVTVPVTQAFGDAAATGSAAAAAHRDHRHGMPADSVMVGDGGGGGTAGDVPAPAAGDTAAGKYLKADATWSAPSGTGAPSDYPYVGFGTSSGLSAEVDLQVSQLTNEIKGWPPCVNTGDLDALLLWFRKVGTPTIAPTVVAVSGIGGGVTVQYGLAIKVQAAAANDGMKQTWTYTDEPRIKSGRALSTLWAIWCVSGVGVTLKLLNSDASSTAAAKVTAAAWTIVEVPNHTLAGTTCDVQLIADGAGTFYAVPLGANIGSRGFPLELRPQRHIETGASLIANVDPGGSPAGYITVDCTATSSPLTTRVELYGTYNNVQAIISITVRRKNGSGVRNFIRNAAINVAATAYSNIEVDDSQAFEYASGATAGNTEALWIDIIGWWEWA